MAAAAVPPRYMDFKEQIRTEIFTIKQKMNDLRQLHGRAALTSFDDTDSNEVQIEVVTQDITRLFRKCEARLQQFTAGAAASEADEKVGCPCIVLASPCKFFPVSSLCGSLSGRGLSVDAISMPPGLSTTPYTVVSLVIFKLESDAKV